MTMGQTTYLANKQGAHSPLALVPLGTWAPQETKGAEREEGTAVLRTECSGEILPFKKKQRGPVAESGGEKGGKVDRSPGSTRWANRGGIGGQGYHDRCKGTKQVKVWRARLRTVGQHRSAGGRISCPGVGRRREAV